MALDKPIQISGNRNTGLTVIILGALILFGSAFAYSYVATEHHYIPGYSVGDYEILKPSSYDTTSTPLRDYTTPLVICGIAVMVVGFAVMFSGSKVNSLSNPEPSVTWQT
jgi:hypothetical protein